MHAPPRLHRSSCVSGSGAHVAAPTATSCYVSSSHRGPTRHPPPAPPRAFLTTGYIRIQRFGDGKEPCYTDNTPSDGDGCSDGEHPKCNTDAVRRV